MLVEVQWFDVRWVRRWSPNLLTRKLCYCKDDHAVRSV